MSVSIGLSARRRDTVEGCWESEKCFTGYFVGITLGLTLLSIPLHSYHLNSSLAGHILHFRLIFLHPHRIFIRKPGRIV